MHKDFVPKKYEIATLKATSKNVIPPKAGIQKPLIILDSRLRGGDEFGILRGSLKTAGRNKYLDWS
jgi:hypothetical protein